MAISAHSGMGARTYPGGVSFRVWAPFAASVAVAGEFNGWSAAANPLTSDGNGYWSADVAGAAAGQPYKYVIVNGSTFWRNDPYAEEIKQGVDPASTEQLTSVIYDPGDDAGDDFRIAHWNELVIYELHIGTFNEQPTDPSGTFQEATTKLDYLRDLGINAIEIMAAGEFGTDTSWGYNPAYIYAIEHAYGGPKQFKQFVTAAHARGIAVIFDAVYNHLGPQQLDLWQFDGWNQNGKGGIYFYEDGRSQTPWGDTRPDYGRREVQQYLRDNALMWLERRYVDGLRWDATGYIRNVFGRNIDPADDIFDGWNLMHWINGEIRAQQGWKISIAEDMQGNERITTDVGAGFDAQWGADFVHPVRNAIIGSDDAARSMYAVRDAIQRCYNGDAFQRVIYTESHDEDANGQQRVPEEIWPGNAASWYSEKRSTLGAALVCTAPGIPMIFQGQEFLEDGYFSDRRRLDWTKATTHGGIVQLYRDLIRLRRNQLNNTRGLRGQRLNMHHVNDTDKVIAFHRWDQRGPGDDVLVVLNMANRAYDSYTLGFPRGGTWKVRFNSDWSGYAPDFGNHLSYDTAVSAGGRDGMPYSGDVGIGPYTAIILSQDS
jgi:1,4-alpha-glucan branching enzyme